MRRRERRIRQRRSLEDNAEGAIKRKPVDGIAFDETIQRQRNYRVAAQLPGCRTSRFRLSRIQSGRLCGRLLLARARLPEYAPSRQRGVLAKEAGAQHTPRQGDNRPFRKPKVDGAANLGVRVAEKTYRRDADENTAGA